MKGITKWRLDALLTCANDAQKLINGLWVPARPLGLTDINHRLRCALDAFTGKADLVYWPRGQ